MTDKPLTPGEGCVERLNLMEKNFLLLTEASSHEARTSLLMAAQVQATAAHALATLALAHATRESVNPSPGQSIRYGLEPLVTAIGQLVQAVARRR